MTGTENSTATTGVHGPWMPIESAPKDRRILLCCGTYIVIGAWGGSRPPCWKEGGDFGRTLWMTPTHWMSIPAAPTLSDHQSDDNPETRKKLSPIQTTNKSP